MNEALLLIAHGSRHEASNDEVRALTARLRSAAAGRFEMVDCAFLELAEPSIPDGIERLIDGGAQAVTVLPYFLAAGRHVIQDVPALVEEKRAEHPEVDIRITPYLGTSDEIPRLLLSLV